MIKSRTAVAFASNQPLQIVEIDAGANHRHRHLPYTTKGTGSASLGT